MKNNILIITVFFALFLLNACEKDDYMAPDTLSDVAWYTGIHPGELYAVNVGEYISFMDVSQGALSHQWTIDQGDNYLSPTFAPGDSLPLFIIPNAPLSTSDLTIHVLFNNVGVNKVRLYNTFSDSVSYNGTIPFPAVKQGSVWVIDTTFIIDVYDAIKPAVNVYQDGVLVVSVPENTNPVIEDQASWDTVYVEAGGTLTYTDVTTTGRPNGREWIAKGGSFNVSKTSDSIATVHYFGLGSYTSSINSSRGGDLPDAKSSKLIPMIVKVIPSSKPFEAVEGSFTESEDETISFNVSGEIAPFTGQEEFFTVHVENAAKGFSKDIAVSSAKVNNSKATVIDLELAEPIFNTDVITVMYAGGNIKSVDFRTLKDFTAPQTVKMHLAPNSLNADWAGFEIAGTNHRAAYCDGVWVGPTNDPAESPVFSRVEGSASPSGTPCMSYTMIGGISKNMTLQGSKFNGMLPDMGTYTYLISFKIYIEPGSNMTKVKTAVLEPFLMIEWDLSGVAEGQWVTLSQVVTFDSLPTKRFDFKVDSEDNPNPGDVKLFFDDYSFILLEERQ